MGSDIRRMRDGEPAACEAILRTLPDWFGIEEAIVEYARAIEGMDTWVADAQGEIAGFLSVKPHTPRAAEIHVMAVLARHHGEGVGRRLVEAAEAALRGCGTEFLQVKTLAPSHPDPHYARTRAFYEHLGFAPLEESELWGPSNPCLTMVKHLACGGPTSCSST